jgi:hypothetical protein
MYPDFYDAYGLMAFNNYKNKDSVQLGIARFLKLKPSRTDTVKMINYYDNLDKMYTLLKDYKNAAKCLQVEARYSPHDKTIYYDIAAFYSLLKNKSKSLKYLELSIMNGYRASDIEENALFSKEMDFISVTDEYQALIEKYKKTENPNGL